MRNFVVTLLLFFSMSCTKAIINENNPLSDTNANESNFLTVEQALEELFDFDAALYGCCDVKSQEQIDKISLCKIPSTKSEYFGEVAAYVVNYKDDRGFAVINADKFSAPIVARTESGSLDYRKLNETLEKRMTSVLTKTGISDSCTIEEVSPEEFVYTTIANSLLASPRIAVDTLSVTYGEWEDVFRYGPFVTVKWGQTYPFNMHIPYHSSWATTSYSYYRGLPPVGCTNVALAQVLATVKHPECAPGTNDTYAWDALEALSNYTNVSDYIPGLTSYPFDTNPTLMGDVYDLADHMYALFLNNNSTVKPTGTGASLDSAVSTMRSLDAEYFAAADTQMYNSNSSALTTCLRANKPVCCCGYYYNENNKLSGHTWVIDGYSKRQREVTIVTQCGYMDPQVRVRIQTSNFFHINWGYCGKYDGYYHVGVFDMTQREDIDSIIDTNPYTLNGTHAYDVDIEYISY